MVMGDFCPFPHFHSKLGKGRHSQREGLPKSPARVEAGWQGHPSQRNQIRAIRGPGLPAASPTPTPKFSAGPFTCIPSRKRKVAGGQVGGEGQGEIAFLCSRANTRLDCLVSQNPLKPHTPRPALGFYLSHQAVGSRVLLVLKYDVRVVVGGEFLKSL